MKKWLKILIGIVATPVLLAGILLLIYVLWNIQGVIEPFQRGNPDAKYKVLVASQGSEYKESLTDELIKNIEADSIFISVIDVTGLESIDEKNWDAIVIIHTMQIHKMPKQAMRFLEGMPDLNKVMLVSTSGAGDDQVDYFEVDAVSTVSRKSLIPRVVELVIPKLEEDLGIALR
ncbi:MAG: hypothetical protein KOO63_14925 [Bacteroidales bacterium]|nr:hypothetical protein [Candidatus Latescibacterota bacterium]